MQPRKYIILIFIAQCYHCNNSRKVSDIYDFVVQLRNNSDSIHEYIAMIQAIFCPEQPICTDGGAVYSYDVLATLPAELTVDNETLRVKDIKDFVGICCLPCSCSETCQEDDSCCPTKYNSNEPPNQVSVIRECFAATVGSYTRPAMIVPEIPRYFMTTKCFEDKSGSSLVSKCESPDNYNQDETIPVTSVGTGRTYWNKHCAICNGDTETLLQWTSRLNLERHKFIYFDVTTPVLISTVKSLEDLHVSFARNNKILYTPPVAMDSNRCFERRISDTCAKQQEPYNKTELCFLQQICERLYNPVYDSGTTNVVYLNIFCFLCRLRRLEEIIKVDECGFEAKPVEKLMSKQMTAVLDYKTATKAGLAHKHHPHYFEEEQNVCPCNQFYDFYKMLCRPLLCPVGEFLIECDCVQPIKNLSGMPVSLNLQIVPKMGNLFSPTATKVRKFNAALTKMLQTTVSNIKVDIVVTFSQEKDSGPYYLCIAVVQTKTGLDTKETLKTLIPFLDTSRSLEFFSVETTFFVHFFTREFVRYNFVTQSITDEINVENGTLHAADNKQNAENKKLHEADNKRNAENENLHGADNTKNAENENLLEVDNKQNAENEEIHEADNKKDAENEKLHEAVSKQNAENEKLHEADNRQNLTLIYSNAEFVGNVHRIQVLSPLMYCKQVQLDKDEFIQEQDKIIIKTSSKIMEVWDFYPIPPSQVRICVDKYQVQTGASVATQKFVSKTLVVLWLLSLYLFIRSFVLSFKWVTV